MRKYEEYTFQHLVGKMIVDWELTNEKHHLIFTVATYEEHAPIKEKLLYQAEGDCCAHCWIESIEGEKGGVVLEVLDKGWNQTISFPEGYCQDSAEETCFWTLKTTKGYIDIETRVSHNGYYGGSIGFVGVCE